MNKLILAGAGLAALAALPAAAQLGPGAAVTPRERAPAAQPLTRAAVEARVQARFARVDANRDGFVTREEAQARRQGAFGEGREPRGELRRGRGEGRAAVFDRLDANGDGQLSRQEFDAGAGLRAGRPGRGGARLGGRGFGGRGFAMLDADRDGRVSMAEARTRALQAFERADANRDGVVTPDERQVARAALRARFQGRRAG